MTNGTHRSRSDIAILIIVLVLVLGLIIWFFAIRPADEGRVNIEVPELPAGGGNR